MIIVPTIGLLLQIHNTVYNFALLIPQLFEIIKKLIYDCQQALFSK